MSIPIKPTLISLKLSRINYARLRSYCYKNNYHITWQDVSKYDAEDLVIGDIVLLNISLETFLAALNELFGMSSEIIDPISPLARD